MPQNPIHGAQGGLTRKSSANLATLTHLRSHASWARGWLGQLLRLPQEPSPSGHNCRGVRLIFLTKLKGEKMSQPMGKAGVVGTAQLGPLACRTLGPGAGSGALADGTGGEEWGLEEGGMSRAGVPRGAGAWSAGQRGEARGETRPQMPRGGPRTLSSGPWEPQRVDAWEGWVSMEDGRADG